MRDLWLVAKHEYRQTVVRRAFVLLTLAIPVGFLLIVGLVIVVERSGSSKLPVGYVDHSGLLDARRIEDLSKDELQVPLIGYSGEESALAALNAGEIQAVFVFPPGYPETLDTELYYKQERPDQDAVRTMSDFVRVNLIAPLPEAVGQRLMDGANVVVYDVTSGRRFAESDILSFVLPVAGAFAFFFASMMSAGYMLGVVAGEKENRTIEILITSVTPGQLIGGKTLGLLAAALTQLSIYALAAVVAMAVASVFVTELQQMTVPWGTLGLMVLFFLPTYVLVSALMVAIGAAVTEVQQGQQVAGMLNLLFVIPFLVMPLLIENSGSPVAVALTLFPTTSFLSVTLRWSLGTVPMWQLGTSWLILVATAALTVWAAGRIFRAGMLRYLPSRCC